MPVDGFELASAGSTGAVYRGDRFELTVFRRPTPSARPDLGLSGTWPGQAEPVLRARVTELEWRAP